MNPNFTLHDAESIPAGSVSLMRRSTKTYGFFPNLHRVLAEAPAAYRAYLDTFSIFECETSLSALEQQIVFQVANFENNCKYCMPGHSYLMTAAEMPQEIIHALREGMPLADTRLEALRQFTISLINQRGHVSEDEIQKFFAEGFTSRQALEILIGLASKLISNFTNSLADTPLDNGVEAFQWTHPQQRTASVATDTTGES